MEKETYPFQTNESYLDFEFYSVGPKGKIKKVIRFTPRNAGGITYFNLGFGDWNEVKKKVDDLAVSDNHDREKVLATIAATVLEFTAHFPDMPVYAKGSTAARTRLYQMGIAANWNHIAPLLYVYGFADGEWQSFKKSVNYQAFMVLRKKV
jgi:hypothetical protein